MVLVSWIKREKLNRKMLKILQYRGVLQRTELSATMPQSATFKLVQKPILYVQNMINLRPRLCCMQGSKFWLLVVKNLCSYNGCAVTPCSPISQASCRSPDDRRGAALPQEDVGGHVGVNHTQKVSRKGGNGENSGQTPRGSGEPLRGF